MPRPRSLKPTYCHDRSSGRAFVTLSGKRIYLGKHGSQESRDAYDREVGEWIKRGRVAVGEAENAAREATGPTVSMIVLGFWEHAQNYYRRADGSPTSEINTYKQALAPLRRLYGATPAKLFGPLKLETLRAEYIKIGWCRKYVNDQVFRIKLVFRWAASKEHVPAGVSQQLETLASLRAGYGEVRESEPVQMVAPEIVEATMRFLNRHIRAMVELEHITGMRPTELCMMRGCDIEMPKDQTWWYRPPHHKNKHRGQAREIPLGPRAREIIAPFLRPNVQEYLFSPAEAEAERLAALHSLRVTPLSCGNRPGPRNGKRRPRDHYDRHSYYKCIQRGCDRADAWAKGGVTIDNAERMIPRWFPYQLRHTAATKWRAEHGADNALVLLGDKTGRMVDVYAEKNRAAAKQIAEKIG